MQELLLAEEFAEIVKTRPPTVQRWCRDGLVPGARRFGRRWLIPASALEAPPQAHEEGRTRHEEEATR